MNSSELPGEGSQQSSPLQTQQPFSAQPNQGFPSQPTKTKKPSNVIGLIALIVAVIGFIFACVPGALIIGWIFLPIAFVLALVSLFLKGKSKWMGVTALILSIIGTIVGVTVFLSVVSTSFDDAFGGGTTTVVEPSSDGAVKKDGAAEKQADAKTGTRENPYALGSTIESKDWRVVINSVTLAATDVVMGASEFNEAPAEGSEYILVNYSATYIGDDPNGQMPALMSIDYVTADGKTVNSFDNFATVPDPIDTTSALYKDGTATGNAPFVVPSATADQGVLAVRPGMLSDKIFVAVK